MSLSEKVEKKFKSLIEEGQAILQRSGWDGKDYHSSVNVVDYRRFRTEALNLVKRVCGENSDHYQELKRLAEHERSAGNSYFFKDCFGALQAAHKDYEDGLLFDLRALIAAEVLGDFVEQAEALVSQGYHIPAASLSGAVLEDTLRKLAKAHGLDIPEKTKIDRLNSDLARAEIYSKLVQKRITALADIRNNADHGHFDKFSKDDVEDMVTWIKRFAADYLD
ncbi:MAG: HEPN domain-containing protein [Nitrospiraceae bacterium]|nr:MAG: HEPN domain-containing protein [Nitrospiraceae bacterium]